MLYIYMVVIQGSPFVSNDLEDPAVVDLDQVDRRLQRQVRCDGSCLRTSNIDYIQNYIKP